MAISLTVGFREFLLKLAAGPQGSYTFNNGLCTGRAGATVSTPAFIRKHTGGLLGPWTPEPSCLGWDPTLPPLAV